MPRCNIFLDFLNRDSRVIYRTYELYDEQVHIDLLKETINLAGLLCLEYCVIPPGFSSECLLAQRALQDKRYLLREGVIRVSLREETWEDVFGKKKTTYSPVAPLYPGLYDPSNIEFLRTNALHVLRRETKIGDRIAGSWVRGPDCDLFWEATKKRLGVKILDKLIKIPGQLIKRDVAAVWPNIMREFNSICGGHNIELERPLLQHAYFGAYQSIHNLAVMYNLPFSRTDFGLSFSRLYDYNFLKLAFESAGIWHTIRRVRDCSLLLLREQRRN